MAEEGDLIKKRNCISVDEEGISVYLLFTKIRSDRACGIYEFKIPKITTTKDHDDDFDGIFSENKLLQEHVNLFEQPRNPCDDFGNPRGRSIDHVACAPLPNQGSCLLIPSEFSREEYMRELDLGLPRLHSVKLNLFTNETVQVPTPSRKDLPFAASLNNKVYVLSCPKLDITDCLPDRVFESFDPETDSWEPLQTPPFYNLDFNIWVVAGFAVFKDYIIFSLSPPRRPQASRKPLPVSDYSNCLAVFYSYHTLSGQWNPVQVSTDRISAYRPWYLEAVVVDGALYGYIKAWKKPLLLAFPFLEKELGTLYLEPPVKVDGWRFYTSKYTDPLEHPYVSVGKIGDRLLCDITNVLPQNDGEQPVHIAIYSVPKFGCFRLLGSAAFRLPIPDEHEIRAIWSCFSLQPGGDDGKDNELHRDKRARDSEIYDGAKASAVEITESNMEIDVPEIAM